MGPSSDGPTGDRRFSELGRRTVVAIVLLPLVAVTIAAGPRSSGALFGIAAAIGCSEYYRLTLGSIPTVAWIGIIAAGAMPLAVGVLGNERVAPVLLAIAAVASIVSWVVHLLAGPRATAPQRVGHIMAGLLFSSVGLVALSALRVGGDGIAWVAIVLVGTWANDVAAYLGGRAFGRKKLWPALSGHLLPGHGGMLDRIDSVLFASPVILLVRRLWFPD